MDYKNLKSFLSSKKNDTDRKEFLEYIRIIGIDAVCEDAWELSSFDMMRKTDPDFTIGAVTSWSYGFDFGDGYFEYTSFKPNTGKDYNSFWYRIDHSEYVNGDGEFVEFPEKQKEWCINKFKSFITEYYERRVTDS